MKTIDKTTNGNWHKVNATLMINGDGEDGD